LNPEYYSNPEGTFITSESPLQFFIYQEKTASSGHQGWKIEGAISGFLFHSFQLVQKPVLKVIRKILIVDPLTFTSCKSQYLYPYHEFS
jgi:hypothetical protein